MPSALVNKLRKQPEVRDAEALAAWIGRYQKLRKAGVSNKKAMKLAGKKGGMKQGGVKKSDRTANGKPDKTGDDAIGKYGVDKRTEASLRASEVSGGNDIGNGERRRRNMERSKSFDENLTGEKKAKREKENRVRRLIAADRKKVEPGSLIAGFDDKPYKVKRVSDDGMLETDGGTIDPRFTRNVSSDPDAKRAYDAWIKQKAADSNEDRDLFGNVIKPAKEPEPEPLEQGAIFNDGAFKQLKGQMSFDTKTSERSPTAMAKEIQKKIAEDDDPFAEDYYADPFDEDTFADDLTPGQQRERDKYEAQVMKGFEDAERGKLYNIFLEQGGLKTRDDLREEYREIPNTYKRKDGMAGDEMAEYLGTYYPEFGIESERDLISFFAG